ncbi:MAG: hypothetical protein A2W25_17460 [candidate division Zixibacteria bacterium RBG_16_53_22]|nr:MAG: hypothetical protein A2W25_17460 [candidate division Zixibacteria bacterium RBG_16_53_22]
MSPRTLFVLLATLCLLAGSLSTGLAVGETKSFAFPIGQFLPSGTKTAAASVDPQDVVKEKDETNNEKSVTFIVQ